MTDEFENELRQLMRPVEAPEGLTDRIMAALPPKATPASVTPIASAIDSARGAKSRRNYWMPGALAASLIGAVLLGTFAAKKNDQQLAHREEAAGLEARRELMEALRVTSQKLDLAYEAVNAPPPAQDEENRT
jgi:hypothetical protein